jgi:hypothetical protein
LSGTIVRAPKSKGRQMKRECGTGGDYTMTTEHRFVHSHEGVRLVPVIQLRKTYRLMLMILSLQVINLGLSLWRVIR